MSDTEKTTANVPITVNIDVEALVNAELGLRTTNYRGGFDPDDFEPDDFEPEYEPGDGRLIDIVADKMAARVQRSVQKVVEESVRAKVLEKVDGLIEEIMESPVVLTSTLGEPKKAPEMSMREAMIKAMVDRLDEGVDSNGKRRDRGDYYGSHKTYLEWRAEQVARLVIDKEMDGRISTAVKQIRDAAKDLVGKKISDALGRAIL